MMNIDRCPSTLVSGFTSYSPGGLRKLFDGKKVSPILPYDAPDLHGEPEEFLENREHISISGFRKNSLFLLTGNNPSDQGRGTGNASSEAHLITSHPGFRHAGQ